MSLNGTVTLAVGETRDVAVNGCHDGNDAWRLEHATGASRIFDVRGPAFVAAQGKRVEVIVLVSSAFDAIAHHLSIAAERVRRCGRELTCAARW